MLKDGTNATEPADVGNMKPDGALHAATDKVAGSSPAGGVLLLRRDVTAVIHGTSELHKIQNYELASRC